MIGLDGRGLWMGCSRMVIAYMSRPPQGEKRVKSGGFLGSALRKSLFKYRCTDVMGSQGIQGDRIELRLGG